MRYLALRDGYANRYIYEGEIFESSDESLAKSMWAKPLDPVEGAEGEVKLGRPKKN